MVFLCFSILDKYQVVNIYMRGSEAMGGRLSFIPAAQPIPAS